MIDLHTHTVYSDGNNTPEEMILSAIDMGLECIGISDHSYTEFDRDYCMKPEDYAKYKAEIRSLAEKYAGKIKVLCGIEQDIYSDEDTEGFDYVIGSVHYVKAGDEYIPVDLSPEALISGAEKYFKGDILSLTEAYYETVSHVIEKTGADIIGHFDLITKFNEDGKLFDESSERYKKAWQKAADSLLAEDKPFEINTGAISRGYRTEPYPSMEIRKYIISNGGKLIWSSDSHSRDNICYGFERDKKI